MKILLWQVGILLGIVISTLLFREIGRKLSSIAAAFWTVFMIFTSWLMLLQFVTILAGFLIGGALINSKNFKSWQVLIWVVVVFAIVGILWLFEQNKPKTESFSKTVEAKEIIQESKIRDSSIAQQYSSGIQKQKKIEPVVYPGEKFNGYARPGECLYSKREKGHTKIYTRSCNG